LHIALSVLMLCGVVLILLGAESLGSIVFGLSFVLSIVIFAGYLFNWVILGIHGPGWIHPVDYFKKSRELRTFLIGICITALIWWQAH
jgi:hypothetical protein